MVRSVPFFATGLAVAAMATIISLAGATADAPVVVMLGFGLAVLAVAIGLWIMLLGILRALPQRVAVLRDLDKPARR